jgi:hypothetical protein
MDFLILAHHMLGFQNSPYWRDQQRYLLYRTTLSQDTGSTQVMPFFYALACPDPVWPNLEPNYSGCLADRFIRAALQTARVLLLPSCPPMSQPADRGFIKLVLAVAQSLYLTLRCRVDRTLSNWPSYTLYAAAVAKRCKLGLTLQHIIPSTLNSVNTPNFTTFSCSSANMDERSTSLSYRMSL